MKLIFNCGDSYDFDSFTNCINDSPFYGESNDFDLTFEFEVVSSDDSVNLESELQKIIDENDINGYFEVQE